MRRRSQLNNLGPAFQVHIQLVAPPIYLEKPKRKQTHQEMTRKEDGVVTTRNSCLFVPIVRSTTTLIVIIIKKNIPLAVIVLSVVQFPLHINIQLEPDRTLV